METCHCAVLASPKALWDRRGHSEEIKRNTFFCIILGELYLNVTCLAVVNWIAGKVVISSFWECGTFSLVNMQFVSICRKCVRLQGQQMEMSCGYHRGRGPDHSLSDRSLILKHTVVQSSPPVCEFVCETERKRPMFPRSSTWNADIVLHQDLEPSAYKHLHWRHRPLTDVL